MMHSRIEVAPDSVRDGRDRLFDLLRLEGLAAMGSAPVAELPSNDDRPVRAPRSASPHARAQARPAPGLVTFTASKAAMSLYSAEDEFIFR